MRSVDNLSLLLFAFAFCKRRWYGKMRFNYPLRLRLRENLSLTMWHVALSPSRKRLLISVCLRCVVDRIITKIVLLTFPTFLLLILGNWNDWKCRLRSFGESLMYDEWGNCNKTLEHRFTPSMAPQQRQPRALQLFCLHSLGLGWLGKSRNFDDSPWHALSKAFFTRAPLSVAPKIRWVVVFRSSSRFVVQFFGLKERQKFVPQDWSLSKVQKGAS